MQVAARWHVLFAEDQKPFGIQLASADIAPSITLIIIITHIVNWDVRFTRFWLQIIQWPTQSRCRQMTVSTAVTAVVVISTMQAKDVVSILPHKYCGVETNVTHNYTRRKIRMKIEFITHFNTKNHGKFVGLRNPFFSYSKANSTIWMKCVKMKPSQNNGKSNSDFYISKFIAVVNSLINN